ncbi:hypothetical protein [Pleionea sp. CnH1-48]|uniref:hypothetical protein n=1 Tax=Pleionea sp. CnH1-48 TaxID=2954494 RepID=UPI002096F153|nr:hypothetical protein [Pleionea sp. CnH1-48]MCO7226808.1 hypothetical protein [Pleionea sp. CnH1-48]
MPEIRSDKSHYQHLGNFFYIGGIIWLISSALLISFTEDWIDVHPFWLVLPGFIIFIVLLIKKILTTNEEFKCKECGQVIKESLKNSGASNEAIIFHCEHCDILWHVGETAG